MAKIIIFRKASFVGAIRPSTIFLDNKQLGQVSNGKTEEFTVTGGSHELKLKLGALSSSNKLNFSISENETKTFKVSVPASYIGILMVVAFVVSFGMEYLQNIYHFSKPVKLLLILIPMLLFVFVFMKDKALVVKETSFTDN